MIIKIIGEIHEEALDKQFTEDAKKLARNDKIVLVLENEIFDSHTDGLMENNIYAIEDRVIWEYFRVINAIYEIYPILKSNKELEGKCFFDCSKEMPKDHRLYESVQTMVKRDLTKYTESYCNFLCNTKVGNPVSKILQNLLEKVIKDDYLLKGNLNPLQQLYTSVLDRREKQQFEIIESEITLISDHLEFFNKVLKLAAKLFREYVINNNYSDKIKLHEGVSETWIENYFRFKLIRPEGESLLNFDAVCVALRNQLFVESLARIASNYDGKDVWFIVGEDHLKGLKELFLAQYQSLKIHVILRDEKQKLIESITQTKEENTLGSQPKPAIKKSFIETIGNDNDEVIKKLNEITKNVCQKKWSVRETDRSFLLKTNSEDLTYQIKDYLSKNNTIDIKIVGRNRIVINNIGTASLAKIEPIASKTAEKEKMSSLQI